MGAEAYSKALRLGQKYYRSKLADGKYPYLKVLDEILTDVDIAGENNLGTVEIPMDMIVGTKTAGRRNAFAGNFMPLLENKTEFAAKWAVLYESLIEEGLNDPIKAYEYMGYFYVQEGNKRVSVMKGLGAVSIPGTVTRLIPEKTDEKANRIYYEFLDFYKITGINYLSFTEEGGYTKLISMLPYTSTKWSSEERGDFRGVYSAFAKAFSECGASRLKGVTTADALVRYLQIIGFSTLHSQTLTEIKTAVGIMWKEFLALEPQTDAQLSLQPTEFNKKSGSFTELIGDVIQDMMQKQLTVGFICAQNARNSDWNYGHELGRRYLEQVFPAKMVVTKVYENAKMDNIENKIDMAVHDGCGLIFTTSSLFIHQTLKAALKYPQVKFLNCSLYANHPSIRTYYARMYEAKFLLGIIAGAMEPSGEIGYIAEAPTYGELANINAFAIGAKMVNPQVKVYLDWYSIDGNKPEENLKAKGITLISCKDWIVPDEENRHFGLFDIDSEKMNVAMAMLDWGHLYEKVVRSVLDGVWKDEESGLGQSINYWWGISSGVVDIISGSGIPASVRQLVRFLKQGIAAGAINPFSGILYDQQGNKRTENEDSMMTPEEILKIDWLCDNIIGKIPDFNSLTIFEQARVRFQGYEPLIDVKGNVKTGELKDEGGYRQ